MRVRALFVYPEPTQGEPIGAQVLPILGAQLKAVSQIASAQFSPLDNSATMTRQRRGALQPGATPRGRVRVPVAPCKGAGLPSALAGRSDRFRNPGRCPGLECGGTFSAGINVVQI